MNTPLISICLPNLNTRPFLEERMETLLAQTMTDFEIIVIDSYSEDGSWEFFQKFKGDPRVKLLQAPRGEFQCWNECMRRARGRYIYIATSDDTGSPEMLERLMSPLEKSPEIAISVCDFQIIDQHSKPMETNRFAARKEFYGEWLERSSIRNGKAEFLVHACLGTTWVTMTTVMFRRDLLQRTGFFRTDCGSFADEEWTLRASLASDIAFVPGKLATWRLHPAQATPSVSSRKQLRICLQAAESVCSDPDAGIPVEWKAISNWQREIVAARRADYLHYFRLWRRAAAGDPAAFVKGIKEGFIHEPRLLASQMLRAFKFSEEFRPIDRLPAARRLLKLFNAEWPPKPVASW